MKRQRISLVIPAYNEVAQIARCLDAVAEQTIMPDEVIVVDNGSTDDTVSIARSYSFVRVVHEAQQGTVYARTAGFNAATGDIIARIDTDTLLAPDWISRIATLMNNPEYAAVTGRGAFYNIPFGRVGGIYNAMLYQYVQRVISGAYTLWGSNMAIRRTAWLAVAQDCHDRLDIDEDIDLSMQLQRYGYRVHYEYSLLVQAALRPGQWEPLQAMRYVATWPRNYFVNRRMTQGVATGVLTIIGMIPVLIASTLYSLRRQYLASVSKQKAALRR